MGVKKKNKLFDVECPYCGRKFLKENLINDGYVTKTKIGDVVDCPHCQSQFKE